MRLVSLGLEPYGPFLKMRLEFGETHGLHFIVGPNEAGKSTALRALRGFLFGIPARSPDAHTHAGKDLRVRATLLDAVGRKLCLQRRKGNKNCLLDSSGVAVEEGVLRSLLGGVGESYFSAMFGLTHADLVEGGQSLLDQQGSLGPALFGAGTGAGMRRLAAELREDARAIFSRTGKKPVLNQALFRYKEAKTNTKSSALKPAAWKRVSGALAGAEAALEEVTRERQSLSEEIEKLTRLTSVIPLLVARDEWKVELEALSDVALLPESATADRVEASRRVREIQIAAVKLRFERDQNISESAKLGVSDSVLSQRSAIEGLAARLGVYNKGVSDLPGLVSRVAAAQQEIEETLRMLGKNPSLETLESLRVTDLTRGRLRSLATEKGALQRHLEQASTQLLVAIKRVATHEGLGKKLPPLRDGRVLVRVLQEAERLGDVEASMETLRGDIARGEEVLAQIHTSLGRYRGSVQECCALILPTTETVEHYRGRFETQTSEVHLARGVLEDFQEKHFTARAAILDLQASGEVSTLEKLGEVRAARNVFWSAVQASWVEGETLPSLFSKSRELSEALSEKIAESDSMADRLREDAERTGRLVSLQADVQRAEQQISGQSDRIGVLASRGRLLQDEWSALWVDSGVQAGSALQMRGWLAHHQKLSESALSVSSLKHDLRKIEGQQRLRRQSLGDALADLQEPRELESESWVQVLSRCTAVAAKVEEAAQERLIWERQGEDAAGGLSIAEVELPAAQEAMARWQEEWSVALADIGMAASTTVDEMEVVISGLGGVFEKWRELRQNLSRISHIEGDNEAFCTLVSSLAHSCAPLLEDLEAPEASMRLAEALRSEMRNQETRARLAQRLQVVEREVSSLETEQAQHEQTLQTLMERAGVSEPGMLPAVEEVSARHHFAREQLAEKEKSLLALAVGVPLTELEQAAADVSIDSLPGRLSEIRRLMEAADLRVGEAHKSCAALRQEFESMDVSVLASQAAQEAQSALAEIRLHATDYARLILAEHVLATEVERYRKANQGPVLARGGLMFRRMTVESFSGVETDYNAKDEPVLACIRASGQRVGVAGLSTGTRDQLFLALRLASLELHAKSNEPLPLIMDDLLIHFDDERSTATMELLLEVSRTTQVLFFTHHEHLLQLARRSLPDGSWSEHHLLEA